MDNMSENNNNRPILDIATLRNAGLRRVGELCGNIWTDHNVSDPGITILESLCFSILDLGYRMTFDIRDLLTEEGCITPEYKNVFHQPYQVLSSAPLTINDYRKLILENIDGIKNVWLQTKEKNITIPEEILDDKEHTISIKGYYNVFIDCIDNAESKKKLIIQEIEALLHKNRNLCEDFFPIDENHIMEHLPVGIDAAIEVEPDYNYEAILEKIIVDVSEYVSPDLQFYSLDEMLQKGKSVSDIFNGSFPKKGYVDINEMEDFDSINTLYISDIINIIMQIEGVVAVRKLRFTVSSEDFKYVNIDNHKISFKEGFTDKKVFRFYEGGGTNENKLNNIEFLLNDFHFTVKPTEIEQKRKKQPEFIYQFEKENSLNRKLDKFYSIQNDFPAIYKVGQEGVSDFDSDLRKAQRMQMKAYLLFFDQLFADFLIRINHAKHILSWEKAENLETWEQKQKNYLHKILNDTDVGNLNDLVKSTYTSYFKENIFDADKELEHKNKALNHLLARFNEDFVSYSILQYIAQSKTKKSSTQQKFELVRNKSLMLEKLPVLGYRRATAINYKEDLNVFDKAGENWFEDGNYCPLERKLYIKFGIVSYNPLGKLHPNIEGEDKGCIVFTDNREDDYTKTFGLHIYEHHLLADKIDVNNFLYQRKKKDKAEYIENPYSMKVTVVLPGWLNIVQNHQFRNIIETTIREEFPAHIAIKICWIDPLQMYELEESYLGFLEEKQKNNCGGKTRQFIVKLSGLRNIYHNIKLSDTNTAPTPTLLGYSALEEKKYKWKQK